MFFLTSEIKSDMLTQLIMFLIQPKPESAWRLSVNMLVCYQMHLRNETKCYCVRNTRTLQQVLKQKILLTLFAYKNDDHQNCSSVACQCAHLRSLSLDCALFLTNVYAAAA